MDNQKTLSQLASDALHIQGACNLTGVLRAAHEAGRSLMRHPDCTGTYWVNEHPIMVLYADKIRDLTGSTDFAMAYAKCDELTKGE